MLFGILFAEIVNDYHSHKMKLVEQHMLLFIMHEAKTLGTRDFGLGSADALFHHMNDSGQK